MFFYDFRNQDKQRNGLNHTMSSSHHKKERNSSAKIVLLVFFL